MIIKLFECQNILISNFTFFSAENVLKTCILSWYFRILVVHICTEVFGLLTWLCTEDLPHKLLGFYLSFVFVFVFLFPLPLHLYEIFRAVSAWTASPAVTLILLDPLVASALPVRAVRSGHLYWRWRVNSRDLIQFVLSSLECLMGTVGTLLLENPLGQNGLTHQGLLYEAAKVFGLRSRKLKLFLNETQTQGKEIMDRKFFVFVESRFWCH